MNFKDMLIDQKNEADGIGGSNKTAQSVKDDGIAIFPVPANVKPEVSFHPKLGQPIMVWDYRNKDGLILMRVARFQGKEGKEDRPVTYRRFRDGRERWAFKGLDKPRPLYGLDRLAKMPEASVIICEGEKATDAAQRIFLDYVAVTSPNGAKSARNANWEPLRGRDIIIWPDNDKPGKAYPLSLFIKKAKFCSFLPGFKKRKILLLYPHSLHSRVQTHSLNPEA